MAKIYWLHNNGGTRSLEPTDPADSTDTALAASGGGVATVRYTEAVDTGVFRNNIGPITVEVNITSGTSSTEIRTALVRVGATTATDNSQATFVSSAAAGLITFTYPTVTLGTWAPGDQFAVEIIVRNNAAHGGAAGPTWETGTASSEVSTNFTVPVTHNDSRDEAASLVDSPSTTATSLASTSEASSAVDAPTSVASILASTVETATGDDSRSAVISHGATRSEPSSLVDSTSSTSVKIATASESVSIVDSSDGNTFDTIVESSSLTDDTSVGVDYAAITVSEAIADPLFPYSDISGTTGFLFNTSTLGVGQKFIGQAGVLDYIDVSVGVHEGTPAGTVSIEIYALDSGTDLPTGSPLATSDFLTAADLGSVAVQDRFTFSGANQISLTDGVRYAFVVMAPLSTTTDRISVRYRGFGGSVPDVNVVRLSNLGVWSDGDASGDLAATVALAGVGMTDSSSATSEFIPVVIDEFLDSSGFITSSSGSRAQGQAFTANESGYVAEAVFYLANLGEADDLVARLYAVSGTVGTDAEPTGEPLTSSAPTTMESTIGGDHPISFIFDRSFLVQGGETYAIVVEHATSLGSFRLWVDATSPSHEGNWVSTNDGVTWNNSPALDMKFRLLGAPPPLPIECNQSESVTATDSQDSTIVESLFESVEDSIDAVDSQDAIAIFGSIVSEALTIPGLTPTKVGSTLTFGIDGANPIGQSITVPADAELALFFWSGWSSGFDLVNVTLGGSPFLVAQKNAGIGTGSLSGHGVAYLANPPTGTQTLDWEWTANPGEGPVVFVHFLSDVDPVDPIRDTDLQRASGTSAVPPAVVDSTESDYVVALVERYNSDPNGAPIGSGQTIDTSPFTFSSRRGALTVEDSPGETSSTITMEGFSWSNITAISVRGTPSSSNVSDSSDSEIEELAEILGSTDEVEEIVSTQDTTAVWAGAITESLSLQDDVTAALVTSAIQVESASAADLASETATSQVEADLLEIDSLSDDSSAVGQFSSSASEASSLDDTDLASVQFAATREEAETLIDAEAGVAQFSSLVSESHSLDDDSSAAVTAVAATTESISLVDIKTAISQYEAAAVESTSLVDVKTATSLQDATAVELSSLADESEVVAVAVATAVELASLQDIASSVVTFSESRAEETNIVDASSSVADLIGSTNEPLTIVTTIDADLLGSFSGTTLETVDAVDSSASSFSTSALRDDTAAATDQALAFSSIPVSVAEAATLSETQAPSQGQEVLRTEEVTAVESQSAVNVTSAQASEFLSLTDSQTAQFVVGASRSEISALVDSISATSERLASRSETASLTDTSIGETGAFRVESVSANDSSSSTAVFAPGNLEQASLAETAAAVTTTDALSSDDLAIVDLHDSTRTMSASTVESLSLSDDLQAGTSVDVNAAEASELISATSSDVTFSTITLEALVPTDISNGALGSELAIEDTVVESAPISDSSLGGFRHSVTVKDTEFLTDSLIVDRGVATVRFEVAQAKDSQDSVLIKLIVVESAPMRDFSSVGLTRSTIAQEVLGQVFGSTVITPGAPPVVTPQPRGPSEHLGEISATHAPKIVAPTPPRIPGESLGFASATFSPKPVLPTTPRVVSESFGSADAQRLSPTQTAAPETQPSSEAFGSSTASFKPKPAAPAPTPPKRELWGE